MFHRFGPSTVHDAIRIVYLEWTNVGGFGAIPDPTKPNYIRVTDPKILTHVEYDSATPVPDILLLALYGQTPDLALAIGPLAPQGHTRVAFLLKQSSPSKLHWITRTISRDAPPTVLYSDKDACGASIDVKKFNMVNVLYGKQAAFLHLELGKPSPAELPMLRAEYARLDAACSREPFAQELEKRLAEARLEVHLISSARRQNDTLGQLQQKKAALMAELDEHKQNLEIMTKTMSSLERLKRLLELRQTAQSMSSKKDENAGAANTILSKIHAAIKALHIADAKSSGFIADPSALKAEIEAYKTTIDKCNSNISAKTNFVRSIEQSLARAAAASAAPQVRARSLDELQRECAQMERALGARRELNAVKAQLDIELRNQALFIERANAFMRALTRRTKSAKLAKLAKLAESAKLAKSTKVYVDPDARSFRFSGVLIISQRTMPMVNALELAIRQALIETCADLLGLCKNMCFLEEGARSAPSAVDGACDVVRAHGAVCQSGERLLPHPYETVIDKLGNIVRRCNTCGKRFKTSDHLRSHLQKAMHAEQ